MPHGDDLDARFNEVVSQIGADEQRRMRTAATRGVKPAVPPQPARRPRRPRGLLAIAVVITVLAAASTVVAFRPDLVTPTGT
ncbi:MAG: hypothetical protein HOY71_56480, partial [Nonomuraea sp.]|nr:hypothetical protein [Nonomuraea sp.]